MQNAKPIEPLEKYLQEVQQHLKDLPAADVSEILQELRSHVLDRIDGDLSDDSIGGALIQLGDPKEIARVNMSVRVAAGAAGRSSPRVIAGTLVRLARLSVRGLVALVISLLGYGFAAAWLLTALARPFLPDRVGLWSMPDPTGDLSLKLGRLEEGASGRDILGWWIIPLGLVIGLCSGYLTYRYHQRAIRGMAQSKLGSWS